MCDDVNFTCFRQRLEIAPIVVFVGCVRQRLEISPIVVFVGVKCGCEGGI